MKKKLSIALTIIALILLPACGGSSQSGASSQGSQSESREEETADVPEALSGSEAEAKPSLSEELLTCDTAGMAIATPKTYLDYQDRILLYYDGGEVDNGFYAMYFMLYPNTYEELMNMTDEEFDEADQNSRVLMSLYRINKDWDEDDIAGYMKWAEGYDNPELEIIYQEGDETIYANTLDNVDDVDLPDDLKTAYGSILSEIKEAKGSLKVTEPVPEESLSTGNILSFETTTLNGEPITSDDIFSGHEYTMINCWTSWCEPCINEIPELEELNKKFQEKNCAIVGVLMDGNTKLGLEDGKEIMEQAGTTYQNIIVWDDFNSMLQVTAYPTSFFVDSNGQVVGESIIGAMPSAYEEALSGLLGE